MNKSSSLLDELSSLSKNDIGNFMLNNTRFSDILIDKSKEFNHTASCSNIVNNTKNRLNEDDIKEEMHIRGKTTFNFDFNEGTFKTSLNGIEEQSEDKGSVNNDDFNSDNITTNISPEENNDNKSKSTHTINLDNNNSFRISKQNTINNNSAVTNTKIDFAISLLKPFFSSAFDDNVTQCTSFRSTTDEDYSLSLTKEKVIVLSNEEISTMCCVIVENEMYIIGGTDKGAMIVIKMSKNEIINRIDTPIEQSNNMISSMLKTMCSYNGYLVCGYSNGVIVLYSIDIKGNVKKIEVIKNITTNAILSVKLFKTSDKKSIGIYVVDAIGNIIRCVIKRALFKTKIETKTVITDNDYPYYDIDIMLEDDSIIAIGNLNKFEVIDINNKSESIMHIDTNENINKYSIVYLPSFFFSHNRTLYISINNIMFIYKISKENTSILISSISYENPILDIGLFSAEVVYIVDSEMKISLADYSNRTYLNDLLTLSNEVTDTNSIYHPKQQKFIKRYINGVINKYKAIKTFDNCMFVYDSKKEVTKIGIITVEEYINKLTDNECEYKWKKTFDILIDIYNGAHPIYKVDSNLYEGLVNKISMKFVTEIFVSHHRESIHDYNENIETQCNFFIYYLIKINHISFIMKELLSYLSSINKQKILFSLLEPYILTNNFRMNSITPSFIIEMISTYSIMNKRQLMCKLLLHFDLGIIISDESIYLKVISSKLYPMLIFISLHNKGRNFMKPIEIMLNELNYNRNDCDLLNDFDFNCDNKVYTKSFIILMIIWYVNEIIDRSNTMPDEDNQRIIDLLQSENTFILLCVKNDFINEYFYLLRKIIDKSDTSPKVKRSIISTVNSYLSKNNSLTQIAYSFYLLVIDIAAIYSNVDLSNDLKIKAIIFLLSYHRFNESELVFDNIADALSGESPDSNNVNEDNMIKVIKGLDSITNDDSTAMLNACENSSCFMVRNFIKDLFTK